MDKVVDILLSAWPVMALVTGAAFFKAVADSMEHHPDYWPFTPFWNTRHPLNDKVKRIGGYPLDGWHIGNSLMIACFLVGYGFGCEWYHIPVLAVLFVIVFNIFYNKIFR